MSTIRAPTTWASSSRCASGSRSESSRIAVTPSPRLREPLHDRQQRDDGAVAAEVGNPEVAEQQHRAERRQHVSDAEGEAARCAAPDQAPARPLLAHEAQATLRPAMATRALTIGIDARAAAEVPAGRGRVVRELLRALAERDDPHTYRCYARTAWDGVDDPRFAWELIDAADPRWNLRAARRASRQCDVVLSTNSYLTTWFLTVPGVPIVYDLVTFEPTMQPSRRSMLIERATLGLAVRRSAAFLSISEATSEALVEHFPRAASRTTTALLGVSETPSLETGHHDLPASGFVLAVGTLEPRKNLPRLVAAYRGLPEELQDRHPLVVVGALGWETGETLDALESLGSRCLRLGYVSDAELGELYRRCAAFCYPSLGEGFGLPVLEAMAAGAPVITSNVSSLPEVGGEAVAYADPFDVTSIQQTLARVLSDPEERARLARAGPRASRALHLVELRGGHARDARSRRPLARGPPPGHRSQAPRARRRQRPGNRRCGCRRQAGSPGSRSGRSDSPAMRPRLVERAVPADDHRPQPASADLGAEGAPPALAHERPELAPDAAPVERP